MRLLVLFDLPTGTKAEKRHYVKFREFLLQEGYHMEQFSVYSRLVLSRDALKPCLRRLRGALPPIGKVTVIEMTEHQYGKRHVLLGNGKAQWEPELGEQLTMII